MFAQKMFAPITTGIMQQVKEKIYERESISQTKMLTKDCPADLAMQTPTQLEIDFSLFMIQAVVT